MNSQRGMDMAKAAGKLLAQLREAGSEGATVAGQHFEARQVGGAWEMFINGQLVGALDAVKTWQAANSTQSSIEGIPG